MFPSTSAFIPVRQVSLRNLVGCLERVAGLKLEVLKTYKPMRAMTAVISPSRDLMTSSKANAKIPTMPLLFVDRSLATCSCWSLNEAGRSFPISSSSS